MENLDEPKIHEQEKYDCTYPLRELEAFQKVWVNISEKEVRYIQAAVRIDIHRSLKYSEEWMYALSYLLIRLKLNEKVKPYLKIIKEEWKK